MRLSSRSGFPALEQVRPTARVARQLARDLDTVRRSGYISWSDGEVVLRYYLNRPIQRLETVEELSAFLARPEPVYVVMLRRDYVALREAGRSVHLLSAHRAVVGTSGRGLRRQRWGFLLVVTNVPRSPRSEPAAIRDGATQDQRLIGPGCATSANGRARPALRRSPATDRRGLPGRPSVSRSALAIGTDRPFRG